MTTRQLLLTTLLTATALAAGLLLLSQQQTDSTFVATTASTPNTFASSTSPLAAHVGYDDGTVITLNEVGDQVWAETITPADPISALEATCCLRVYAGTDDGRLVGLSLTSGAELFQTQVTSGGPVDAIATNDQGQVFVAGEGTIWRFNADGTEDPAAGQWPYQCGCTIFDIALTAMGTLLVATDNRQGYLLDTDGTEVWTHVGAAPPGDYNHLSVSAGPENCNYFIADGRDELKRICSISATPLWTESLPVSPQVVAAADTDVYVATDDTILSYNSLGDQLWQAPLPAGQLADMAVTLNRRLYTAHAGGLITALDQTDDAAIDWTVSPHTATPTTLAPASGRFAASGQQTVTADVQLDDPLPGELLTNSGTLTVTADVTNELGAGIDQVRFTLDGDTIVTLNSCSGPVCTTTFDTTQVDDGAYTLRAFVRYDDLTVFPTAAHDIFIGNDEFLRITQPRSTDVLSGTDALVVTESSATNNAGAPLDQVEITAGGTVIDTIPAAACSQTQEALTCATIWDSTAAADGPLLVEAEATYTDTATRDASPVAAVVFNSSSCGTGAFLHIPADNATVSGQVRLLAEACDPAASEFRFFRGTTEVATADVGPDGFATTRWVSNLVPYYSGPMTATAFDAQGDVLATAPANQVTIDNFPGFARPTGIVTSSGLEGQVVTLRDDPADPSPNWLFSVGEEQNTTDTSLTVSFPQVPTPTGPQQADVLVRKNLQGGNDPTVTVTVEDEGVPIATSPPTTVVDGTQIVSVPFGAAQLTDPSGDSVTITVEGDAVTTGPPPQRRTVEVGAVRWRLDL